ncbi:hypothetical protein BJY24_003024 [Nocardia transvalensis]|uniref:Uncharacterized protein n=1 Tax=Nocardia transvalensis TaxID=37333 RepID=A0A7W9PDK2_9NOCA|nr:hypothetical protein [Nocardia transvalensis]MBB5914157.1 hypothetical protein [Nocardia transvalensis]
MLGLLLFGIVLVVLLAAVLDYAPRPGERGDFQRATLQLRHSLTDWDASYDAGRPEGPVKETGLDEGQSEARIREVDI